MNSIANLFSFADSLQIHIDTLAKWRVLFSTSHSWHFHVGETFPNKQPFINRLPQKTQQTNWSEKNIFTNTIVYNGNDLFANLKMDSKFITDTIFLKIIFLV